MLRFSAAAAFALLATLTRWFVSSVKVNALAMTSGTSPIEIRPCLPDLGAAVSPLESDTSVIVPVRPHVRPRMLGTGITRS